MPFKYQVGSEAQADEQIAALHRLAFGETAQQATGSLRYHRAVHTPPPTHEEVSQWQDQILEAALQRVEQQAKAMEGENEKMGEEQEEEEEQQETNEQQD